MLSRPAEGKSKNLALDVYVKLMRASERVTGSAHRHLADTGLTVSQFGILEALYHLGPMCQRDLGQKILKSSGNITTVIDNLEKRGLVTRRRDERDRRFVTIFLEPEGGELMERIFPVHAARITEELSILTESEQVELARLCRKLGLKR